ncbi:MAG: hypothetical protein CM1200mP20_14150 [Pseudomonadota bacterium]|nr:MAG: hypothetical protein CM1200mP20_14150 [Pseudomonadota bacterium]
MPHSDRHSQHSSPLTALSPLDGPYARTLAPLRDLFSEYGLIRHRLWLRYGGSNSCLVQKRSRKLRNFPKRRMPILIVC